MAFIQTYGKELVALFVPFITWLLNVGFNARPKLVCATPHSFVFLTDQPLTGADGQATEAKMIVRTASIRVRNMGRKTASKVEIVFNYKPQCINLWPARDYADKTAPDNRYILHFTSLSPKEEIGLEILNVQQELPNLVTVRCDECIAKNLPIQWVRQIPSWLLRIVQGVLLVGMGTLVYGLLLLIQIVVLKTPL